MSGSGAWLGFTKRVLELGRRPEDPPVAQPSAVDYIFELGHEHAWITAV